MIYDVKPGAKLQRNPQISKSFMLKYPQISKSFVPNIPESQNLLHLELRTSYFPQGLVEVAEQVEQVETRFI